VAEDILDQERDTVKRPFAERSFVEAFDPVGIGFDDTVDFGIRLVNRSCGGDRELFGAYLLLAHEFSKTEAVVRCVFIEFHHASPAQDQILHKSRSVRTARCPLRVNKRNRWASKRRGAIAIDLKLFPSGNDDQYLSEGSPRTILRK
jgi:hypothetical protein